MLTETETLERLVSLAEEWRADERVIRKYRNMTKGGLRREMRQALREMSAGGPRKIDGKFHVEGSRIVKTPNGEVLPEDEPLFLFRARDYLAAAALTFYLEQGIKDGCTEYWEKGVRKELRRFLQFAKRHPERMKQPGVTRGL